jgi:hypothetical protein
MGDPDQQRTLAITHAGRFFLIPRNASEPLRTFRDRAWWTARVAAATGADVADVAAMAHVYVNIKFLQSKYAPAVMERLRALTHAGAAGRPTDTTDAIARNGRTGAAQALSPRRQTQRRVAFSTS